MNFTDAFALKLLQRPYSHFPSLLVRLLQMGYAKTFRSFNRQ